MKRENLAIQGWCISLAAAALLLAGSLTAPRPAAADIDVHFGIGNAPPPPAIEFRARPHRWYDRRSSVYVIDDPSVGNYDVFQYGGYYWVFNDGYWYRSRSYRGGFRVIDAQYVPTAIYSVPAHRWHNHPSYASWHDRMRNNHRGWRHNDRRNDRGDQDQDNQGRRRSQY